MCKYNNKKTKRCFLLIALTFFILITIPTSANEGQKNWNNSNKFITVNEILTSPEYGDLLIEGYYNPQFGRVYHEFKKNFLTNGEAGASVCITHKGKSVVDLWGGIADPTTNTPWKKDTVSIVFSSTKGAVSFALQILLSRGLIDLNAPVSDYWPEYAQKGKENTTIKMLLNHQSGILHFSAPLKPGAFADWDYMINAIEQQAPFFDPGTEIGYQMYTHGWLIGEIIKRVTGKSFRTFFQDEIAIPLGLDYSIGLPEEDYNRTATIIPAPLANPMPDYWLKIFTDPNSPQALSLFNDGGFLADFENSKYRNAELPAANGYTNARGLAKMYRPIALGGEYNGIQFIDKKTLSKMNRVYSAGYDKMLLINNRFGLGFQKSIDNRDASPGNRDIYILSETALGTPGYGGSTGFADPAEQISFGYTMNKLGTSIYLNERGQNLINAMYLSLGYQTNEAGSWKK